MKTTPVLLAVALAGCAATPSPMEVPASLAAAETAFAAHSMRENMRPAFLANFADDGMTPRQPGWVRSNEFLATRPNPPIVLDWRPQYVEVAASGELGLSTGPTKLVANAKPDVANYGQYVSVWRREASGTWKVLVDLGIGNATPVFWDRPLQASFVQGARGLLDSAALLEAEASFTRQSAAGGMRSAYATLASDRMRFYRDEGGPAVGLAAANASPGMTEGKLAWTVERSTVAKSGDLGYAIGSYAAVAEPAKVLGYYLRVWRNEDSRWRVAMDVANPAR